MHYFKRNIGDYHKKAGRLTMLQHGAYTLIIDACYDREQFPSKDEALDWAWAGSVDEISAVEFILSKFFTLTDGVYVQARIKEEIDKYHQNAATNKRIAIERETKRKENRTNRAKSVNEAPPNHKPLTTNHKLNNKEKWNPSSWLNLKAWNEFEQHRKEIKKPLSDLARTKAANQLKHLTHSEQQEVIDKSIQSRWPGLFPEKVKKKSFAETNYGEFGDSL